MELKYQIVLCRTNHEQITIEELASRTCAHPAMIEQFVDYGLIEPIGWTGTGPLFDSAAILRVRTINRLRQDLGANLPSVAIILDLVERLRCLQREIESLQGKL
jgi:DNA-binding transcriptional MerR regulator